jgi:hypothetical protein
MGFTIHITEMGIVFRVGLSVLATLAAGSAVADGYLDALKAEATSVTPTQLEHRAGSDREGALRTDDQPQMEQWLQQEFMGTYVFYKNLSDRKKLIVYQAYRDGAPIEELRTTINDLLKD